MKEKHKHKIVTIPNILSLFRLLLIPVIMWVYIVKEDPVLTTVILALSGITYRGRHHCPEMPHGQ